MVSRMMLPLVVVGCTSKQSVSQCGLPAASGVDNAAPRLADTAERDYFHPQREADHYAKTTGRGTQKYINDSVDRVAHIDNPCNYCEQYTRASSGV